MLQRSYKTTLKMKRTKWLVNTGKKETHQTWARILKVISTAVEVIDCS